MFPWPVVLFPLTQVRPGTVEPKQFKEGRISSIPPHETLLGWWWFQQKSIIHGENASFGCGFWKMGFAGSPNHHENLVTHFKVPDHSLLLWSSHYFLSEAQISNPCQTWSHNPNNSGIIPSNPAIFPNQPFLGVIMEILASYVGRKVYGGIYLIVTTSTFHDVPIKPWR